MSGDTGTKRSPRAWCGRPGKPWGTTWWLLAKDGHAHGHARARILTVGRGGAPTLPVFSGEGEAEMFLRFGAPPGDGWRVTETSARELVSVLCGPCAGVRGVALDPLPGMTETEMTGLVMVARTRFLDRFLVPGRGRPGGAPP